jgi:hypothetical protein
MEPMATTEAKAGRSSVSAYVMAVREAMREGAARLVTSFDLGDLAIEVRQSADSLWVVITREGQGGLALRAAFLGVEFACTKQQVGSGEAARIRIDSPLGAHVVVLGSGGTAPGHLRVTVSFTPATAWSCRSCRATSIRSTTARTRSAPRARSKPRSAA